MIRSILVLLILSLILNLNLSAQQSKEKFLIIGTYTSGPDDDGIYVYKFNTETGDHSFVSSVKTSNPSFLAISPDQKFVYAVNENADSTRFTVTGFISSFLFNKSSGRLSFINKQES